MAFNSIRIWKNMPMGWLVSLLLTAFCAGYLYAEESRWWIIAAILAISCGGMATKRIIRISRRLRFIIDATVNGDFSYKFPTTNVKTDERDINIVLNHIVEHLEKLTSEARQNEAFLTCAINLTEIGIAVADAKGNILLHNDASLRLLERPAFTHTCQIPEEAFTELHIKKNNVTLNGKNFLMYTFSDLSQQMQAAEVESWEKLTRVLTHEIMNSLTPIQSIAESMHGKASSKEMAEALSTISSSSHSLMQFVRNFRKFSILPEPQMRTFYLKPLLEKCAKIAGEYANETNISIGIMCFPPELMLYTDEALLSQVLINIIKNAVEANPAHIAIESKEKADESVEIRISNDGEPISDETAAHIFTPFFTTRNTGSGIGLSLSRRIMTHLGGTLSFRTRPETCFMIKI